MNIHSSRFVSSISQSRRGFTLIELLTVIAIIGILAAIIIPTVGAVRASARSSQTLSNLRQIGQGLQAYAADNRDALPGGWNNVNGQSYISWHRVLYSYMGVKGDPTGAFTSTVYHCAIATSIVPFGPNTTEDNQLNFTANGYYMTDRAFESSPGVLGNGAPVTIARIRTPSQAVLVFDGASRRSEGPVQGTANPFMQPNLSGALDAPVSVTTIAADGTVNGDVSRFAFRHSGRSTLYAVMADTSVRSFKRGELLNRHIMKQN